MNLAIDPASGNAHDGRTELLDPSSKSPNRADLLAEQSLRDNELGLEKIAKAWHYPENMEALMTTQRSSSEPIMFSVVRGDKSYFATYTVRAGRVTVFYATRNKSAPVGADAVTTARMLLRELILEEVERRR